MYNSAFVVALVCVLNIILSKTDTTKDTTLSFLSLSLTRPSSYFLLHFALFPSLLNFSYNHSIRWWENPSRTHWKGDQAWDTIPQQCYGCWWWKELPYLPHDTQGIDVHLYICLHYTLYSSFSRYRCTFVWLYTYIHHETISFYRSFNHFLSAEIHILCLWKCETLGLNIRMQISLYALTSLSHLLAGTSEAKCSETIMSCNMATLCE